MRQSVQRSVSKPKAFAPRPSISRMCRHCSWLSRGGRPVFGLLWSTERAPPACRSRPAHRFTAQRLTPNCRAISVCVSLPLRRSRAASSRRSSICTEVNRFGCHILHCGSNFPEHQYFMWSVDDARSDDYRVAYGTSKSPFGPINIPENATVLKKRGPVKGTGHHSVVNVPGTDRWYVAYHRHAIPNGSGYKRETCLARMEFNADGSIRPVDPLAPVFPPGSPGEPVPK